MMQSFARNPVTPATSSSYAGANHNPRIASRGARFITAQPGKEVKLSVTSSDPDGNAVALRWWRWDEADSYAGAIELRPSNGASTRFTLPKDLKPGETIHVVAEATDNGVPALTRYERFVVTITE